MNLPNPPPATNLETQRFWDATEEDRLELPRCTACDTVIWYPRERCPECGSDSVEWFEASGRGEVYSFSVTRRMPGRWGKHVPFVLAYVELEEGPRLMTNIVDCDPEAVEVGQAVEVVFHETEEGTKLPRFRPVSG